MARKKGQGVMSDLISRETAVAVLRAKADMTIGEVKDAASFFNHCANMIEKLPAVDAEPVRHGRWIKSDYPRHDDDSFYVYYNYHCSECEGVTDDRRWLPKYCPNCGAKMDNKGGEEE